MLLSPIVLLYRPLVFASSIDCCCASPLSASPGGCCCPQGCCGPLLVIILRWMVFVVVPCVSVGCRKLYQLVLVVAFVDVLVSICCMTSRLDVPFGRDVVIAALMLVVRQKRFGPIWFENFRCLMFWLDVFHMKWMKNILIHPIEDVFSILTGPKNIQLTF